MLTPTDPLTPEEARALTDELVEEGVSVAERMVRLYQGGAHIVLGYNSWAHYVEAEIVGAKCKSHIYYVPQAALIKVEMIAQHPPSLKFQTGSKC